ncbi:aldehyde dehydrogenase family protein [Priestia filamentosa]|uniref:Aldehyde dehydrogenase n=2 Tax=Priestia filamentosa TaxID=1402861 RepID=A0A1X7EQ77_9BACI|nr:aldehyde dehydrogenase family protein [Priestia filamentosa]AKO93208.1 aldehyde dehydrogenase [Priestia filamentosa]MDT3763348.1 aldehyde dehydrogenase family protein [Priestia filamentosa]OXS69908.1 aldehyde dehydrogenase [Priestia filamentosa]RJS63505.1 aldehyde dehydrogenase [Priestia filamentosa]WRU93803.1 aldehyde dehydrogenase family protein [Priestia filamentosa]
MNDFKNKYNKNYINGKWIDGDTERTEDIMNPYDNSVITSVKLASLQQVKDSFKIAEAKQKEWAHSPVNDRKAIFRKTAEFLQDNREDIIQIISQETGGTLLKSELELNLSIDVLKETFKYMDAVDEIIDIPSTIEGKRNRVYRQPLGVVSSISPFNFPMNLSLRSIVPAIALGNTVVHKADLQVGLTGGSIIARAFDYAGLPKGVFQSILTTPDEIKDEMLENPVIQLIAFTGSTGFGKHIGKVAGENLKRVALELGGNNPFIVLQDADVNKAVDAAIFGKFMHQGQICMCINRLIVHKDLYEDFANKFMERASKLPYGDQTNRDTVIGPLINEKQIERVLELIEKAEKSGNKLGLRGKRIGNVLTPFVFVDVNNSDEIAQTELFSPVVSIIKAESDDHAIELANDTIYGLSSAIFTSDLKKGEEYGLKIDSGMTHINDQTVNDASNIPFGGNKQSGLGRFGNPWIIDEFTKLKWISVQDKYREFPF